MAIVLIYGFLSCKMKGKTKIKNYKTRKKEETNQYYSELAVNCDKIFRIEQFTCNEARTFGFCGF